MAKEKEIYDTTSIMFAKKLRKIRNYKNMTIEQVAKKSGVSRSYITDLENARGYLISKEKLERILQALKPIPQKDKEELFLYYLEKYVPAEILKTMLKEKNEE